MPSAFYDQRRNGWIADYRGLFTKSHYKVRVPLARILSADTAKADAKAFADELDRYCRQLEKAVTEPDVQHALRLGAITEPQARALLNGERADRLKRLEPLTIRDAALSHPSSRRDSVRLQLRYLTHLDQFQAHAGVKYLEAVTWNMVSAWVADLKAKGWSWDTRRHALMYLRRACMMGGQFNLPNVLDGPKVDHQERRQRIIRAWSLSQLAAAIIATEDDVRGRAVIVLGACLGMRPTEIIRAKVPDLEGDVLHIGRRDAKNDNSVRAVVVPACVLPFLQAAAGQRKDGPLIQSDIRRRGRHLSPSGLHQATVRVLTAKPRPPIAPKDLRKTFATWAAPAISAMDLERYLGHASGLHAQVTVRHYLAHHLAEQLRPAALALDKALREALRAATTKPKRRAKAG